MRIHRTIITPVGLSQLVITIIVPLPLWKVMSDFSSITTGTRQDSREAYQIEATAQEPENRSTGKNDALINDLPGHVRPLKTRRVGLFFTVFLTSAGFMLGFAISVHRTVIIPLGRLREGANEIRRGTLDYRVPVPGTNDIARITSQFNEMTDTFKCARKDLERQLFERIAEQRHLQEVLVKTERLGAVEQARVVVRHEVVLNNALRIAEITKRLQEIKMEQAVESEIA